MNNAEEIFELIKNLENGERWKLLEMMYDEYYNKRSNPKLDRIHKEDEDRA